MKYFGVVVIVGFFFTGSCEKVIGQSNALSTGSDSVLVLSYLRKAEASGKTNLDSMFYFAQQAQTIAFAARFKKSEVRAYLIMGISQWKRDNLVAGMDYCEKALALARQYSLKNLEAEALTNIGLINNYQGDYPTALENYQRALTLAEASSNRELISRLLLNKGGIYYNLKDYPRALDYWKQALSIEREIGGAESIASCLNNVGLVYSEMGNYQLSLHYFFETLNILRREDACRVIYPQENIGSIYFKLGKLDSASYYLNKALKGATSCGDPIVQIGVLHGLANVATSNHHLVKAQSYLEEAWKIGKSTGLTREASVSAKSLSELHEKLGNTAKAFSFFKEYQVLRDSIYNTENNKTIGKLEAEHEYELLKREQEVSRRIKELEKEKDLTQERWIKNGFALAFLLMVIISSQIYRSYQKKKALSRHLRDLNDEIEEQRRALAFQADELTRLNESLNISNTELETKVKERTFELVKKNSELETKNSQLADYAFINSHKLRGPVARLLGLIHLYGMKEVSHEERDALVLRIKVCVDELNLIVRQIQEAIDEKDDGV